MSDMLTYEEFKNKYGENAIVCLCTNMLKSRGLRLGIWNIKVIASDYGMMLKLESPDIDIFVRCDGSIRLKYKDNKGDAV